MGGSDSARIPWIVVVVVAMPVPVVVAVAMPVPVDSGSDRVVANGGKIDGSIDRLRVNRSIDDSSSRKAPPIADGYEIHQ